MSANLALLKEKWAAFEVIKKEIDEAFKKQFKLRDELEKLMFPVFVDDVKNDYWILTDLKALDEESRDLFYLTIKKDFSHLPKQSFYIYLDDEHTISAHYEPAFSEFQLTFNSMESAILYAKENNMKISTTNLVEQRDSFQEKLSNLNDLIKFLNERN